jgi:hypothetical protein
MDWTASSEGRHIFYDLDPDTAYEFSMDVANNILNRQLIVVGTTPPVTADVDNDGIRDTLENDAPSNGDANSDGMLDSEQEEVTSFVNTQTSTYSVLQTDCTVNREVAINAESSSLKDPGYEYDTGLMSFTASGCSQSATVTQYFYGNLPSSGYVARKFNPNTGAYVTIAGAVISNVTVGTQSALKVVYVIADNGPLDLNPTIGIITDPSGPGRLAVGVPNTGLRR